ncbi:hypothetical protein L596_014492 [Steinernema carpocapsae]|uniref:Uncharacterized protein n=1 Tax=Steinernema carpocapsae TaxID=34508 RepID=A0A4V6A2T6_STECR|nr:hypothetical protein L596_014492 [Steinernema carpocapsae]
MEWPLAPSLSEDEKTKFHSVSSFQYVYGQVLSRADRVFLFKVNRIMEDELYKITAKKPEERSKSRLHYVYLKLGHVNLRAGDYAKALSAYQKAYKANTDHFWEDPSGYYGLGIVYFHFRAFKLRPLP